MCQSIFCFSFQVWLQKSNEELLELYYVLIVNVQLTQIGAWLGTVDNETYLRLIKTLLKRAASDYL